MPRMSRRGISPFRHHCAVRCSICASATLKWNEPAYHPVRPRIGTTIRLGPLRNEPEAYALFVHCQTSLADTFRQLYPDLLQVDGERALVFRLGEPVPAEALDHCIALALTYHLKGEISAG